MATCPGGSSSSLSWELHFLIAKFLSGGPCQQASKVLIEELEKNEVIPKRIDWLGQSTSQDFQSYSSKYDHIKPEHLLKLVEKLLDRNTSESTIGSLNSTKSLLTAPVLFNPALANKIQTLTHPLRNASIQIRKTSSLFQREVYGIPLTHKVHDSEFFSRLKLQCRSLGHLTAVYCVLFDMTGKFIFTGADDHLVKIWSAIDGRLLTSLRGNSAEITDLAVNKENTLLASSSCDRYIRIWCLATGAPVATLSGHTSNVTSIFFCPMPRCRSQIRYMASTSTDGSCAFWAYYEKPGKQAEFQSKPTLYLERMRPGHAQMICSSFSPGGIFMAAGSADFNVRVYHMAETEGPKRILEVQPHTERVDSISWAHRGVRFISGSKDGTALVWRYDVGDNWRFTKINSWKPLPGEPPVAAMDLKLRPRVTMVGWNADDTLVLTAVSNHLVKVWNPDNGQLVRVLRDHTDEVFVIEPHPIYPRVVCTAGHDGQIFVWDIGLSTDPDIDSGRKVFEYKNVLEEAQGHGAVFDVKWSPDGLSLAATDSHGHILIFSCAENEKFRRLPKELFFHTDYRPLTTDAITNTVLDEQTQVLPHLMPPPFLVNMDGAPYPAQLQRLVPGRENCKEEQLIPNVAVAPGGQAEVIEGLPGPIIPNNARSNIDEMIAQLVAEQVVNANGQGGNNERRESDAQPNERRGIAHRRSGDIEGVRQSRGNWQRGGFYGTGKRIIVPPLPSALLIRSEEIRFDYGKEEENYYQERKNKKLAHSPIPGTSAALCLSPTDSTSSQDIRSRRLRRLAAQAAERRRQEEVQRQNDEEGIPRPNPPQQEISIPQVIPRRNSNRGGERSTQGARSSRGTAFGRTSRGGRNVRRAIRFTIRRDSDGEAMPHHSSATEDSSFSSSDVSGTSSSESEFTDSDWGGGPTVASPSKASTSSPRKTNGVAGGMSEGKKRATRKQSGSSKENEGNGSDNSDEDYKDPRPGPSSQIIKAIKQEPKQRPNRQKRKVMDDTQLLDGISPVFRPSEWFAMQEPFKFPYWAQIGDELVYYRQGHERYIKSVQESNAYEISKKALKSLPWNVKPDLEAQISCRVMSVKYEIKPPRLASLKLAIVDWESGELTGSTFTVTYHDMKNVVDFLILRHLYDKSMRHNWSVNNRFRCLIETVWWLGTITAVKPCSPDFPNSKFLLYKVKWDNDDTDTLSPWDLEVIPDAFEIPEDSVDNGINASEEDFRGTYEVTPQDWPPYGHQYAECDRISASIGEVMSLSIAEPFLTPVDLNVYADYAYGIPYLMDLSTIKARLDNRFYRRLDAVKFDIKYISINTETYNIRKSDIVKRSRIIRDLCLLICMQPNIDVTAEYHSLQRNFHWLPTDVDEKERRMKTRQKSNPVKTETEPIPGCSTSRSSTRLRERGERPKTRRGRGRSPDEEDESSRPWEERCKDLLNKLWNSRDSAPFREPVDIVEYSDYHHQIDTPMDLQSIKEDLLGGNYASPLEFSKDVQLIFSNSKQYNTDKHSSIYQMTLRLKSMFDFQIPLILEDWKRNKNRCSKSRSTRRGVGASTSGSPMKGSRPSTRLTSGYRNGNSRLNGVEPTMSPRKNPTRSATSRTPYVNNEASDEEEEEEYIAESSSDEEPVADGDSYRDKRKRRRRRRSDSITLAPAAATQSPRSNTSRLRKNKKTPRGRVTTVDSIPEENHHDPTTEAEEEGRSSDEATDETKHLRNNKKQKVSSTSSSAGAAAGAGRASTRNSTRRTSASSSSKVNGSCNGNASVTPSPRKNPTRSAASRNPFVKTRTPVEEEHHEADSDEYESSGEEAVVEPETSSEDEYVAGESEHEDDANRGTKRRRSEVSTVSQSNSSPIRRSRRRMGKGYRLGSGTPERQVRRSARVPKKRRRISSEGSDEEERGPTTRFRGRSNIKYEEGNSNSDDYYDSP